MKRQALSIEKTKQSMGYKMNPFQSLLYSTVHVSFQYLQYATNLNILAPIHQRGEREGDNRLMNLSSCVKTHLYWLKS